MFDLDVDSPDKVAATLRQAAEAFAESDIELAAAWQDKSAGEPWRRISRALSDAADRIDKALAK